MKAYMTSTNGNGFLVLQDKDGTDGESLLVEPNGGRELVLQQGGSILCLSYDMVPKVIQAMRTVVRNG